MSLIANAQSFLTCLIEIRRGDLSTENFYAQVGIQQITCEQNFLRTQTREKGSVRRVKRSVIKAMTVLEEVKEEN